MPRSIPALVIAAATLVTAQSATALELPETCKAALASVATLTSETGAAAAVEAALNDQIGKLEKPTWAPGYCRAVGDNFASKAASKNEGANFSTETLIQSGVRFEAFRIAAFRNSGVAPKRFFGYLDEQGLAAKYEKQLKDTATRVAPILNAYASKNNLGVSVTPKEIAVTHIAEGAALLLSTNFANVDAVHPVSGVGLDDYRHGFTQYKDLVAEIDSTFKSRLAIIGGNPERPIADRIFGSGAVHRAETQLGVVAMTFEESVLGTSVMYLWEKSIAEEKRKAAGRAPLATMPLDEQYVEASLVYNSGVLFDDGRAKDIMAFNTAGYLVETSEKSKTKRPPLPVMTPEAADALLERGDELPKQPTSWSAVYHILQRYGAWTALTRFATVFTPDGKFATAP